MALCDTGVQMVAMDRGKYYVSGKLTGLNRPERDFFCKTPAETREDLPKGVDVVAFQCRNPIHRAHYEVRGEGESSAGQPGNPLVELPPVAMKSNIQQTRRVVMSVDSRARCSATELR